jgi:hypothetical protein
MIHSDPARRRESSKDCSPRQLPQREGSLSVNLRIAHLARHLGALITRDGYAERRSRRARGETSNRVLQHRREAVRS